MGTHAVTVCSKDSSISYDPWSEWFFTQFLRVIYLYIKEYQSADFRLPVTVKLVATVSNYLSNNNSLAINTLHRHFSHPSLHKVLVAVQTLVIEQVLFSAGAWRQNQVHADMEVCNSKP